MSSVSSDISGLADISFRKESICEEPSPVDLEVNEAIALHRSQVPRCTRVEEIVAGITHCKNRLKECMNEKNSPVKQMYLDKIVQLSLEKQTLEENGANGEDTVIKMLGHEFALQRSSGRRNPYCEVCMSTIWRMVQSWRRCKACGMRAHDKCATEVHRVCAGVVASRRDFRLALAICEERGLCAQDYACAECETPLAYEGCANMQPRLCEYTGMLFCSNCHWGDTWSIPARIIHNMDARPRPVCRAAKQLLAIVDNRPLIDLSEAHSSLTKYHKELRRVQQLRRNFLLMKCYFVSCR
ncbi:phorbol esters/diacylglycerol binding domain protein, partial [Cooperia oncophora]